MFFNDGVLIIDDTISEILSLKEYFWKEGIGVKYLNGQTIPTNKIMTNLVFLDLHLEEGIEIENIIANTAVYLDDVLDRESRFILVVWSKHQDEMAILEKNLETLNIEPLKIIKFDKIDILSEVATVREKINEKFLNEKSIIMISAWKTQVSKISSTILKLIDDDIFGEDEIDKRIQKLLSYFSWKNLEQIYVETEKKVKVKSAFETLNNIIINELKTMETPEINDDYEMLNEGDLISIENSSFIISLNTKIHTEKTQYNCNSPGTITKINEYLDKDGIINRLLNLEEKICKKIKEYEGDISSQEKIINRIEIVSLEVTPCCDFAQGKALKNKIIYGIKLPLKLQNKDQTKGWTKYINNSLIKQGNNIYKLPLFSENGETFITVFDLRTYTTEELSGEYIFNLKQEILSNIQFEIGKFLSRPGISLL
ncbi:MAG: hypothetical protein RR795_02875 [Cetobacterium sp.]|uniref:hypothetical protein n=1 Tax=Cetobacterium sp. TaxID=2071632 RepID=UPI002FC5E44A